MVGKVINKEKNVIGKIILGALIICVFNFIANEFYFRIDLTKEKRFTLSTSSKNLLKKLVLSLRYTLKQVNMTGFILITTWVLSL